MTSTQPRPILPPTSPKSPVSLSPPTSLPASPRNSTTPSTLTSHFVQALHDYLPSSAPADDAVSCLFFRKGAIIEVFNRDSSGWWDGLSGDVRGWFPSNYVGRIGEAVRQSADFEDEESQEEFEAWRQHVNTIEHTDSPTTDSLDKSSMFVTPSSTNASESPPPPLGTPDTLSQSSLGMQSRVELARALLIEDRRRSISSDTSGSITTDTMQHNDQPYSRIQHIPAWESLMNDLSRHISELVEACASPASTNVQLTIFQVVSDVRYLLTASNTVEKDSHLLKSQPELARQRKIVLSALSKLVLKGKELKKTPETDVLGDQVPALANQLLVEMDVFEGFLQKTLTSDPAVAAHQQVSPRTSLLSLASTASSSTTSLRQQLIDARLSSTSLIAKVVPLPDAQHILQNVMEHQESIEELVTSLLITIEKFLGSRQRATEMLEMTRKAVEAVRTFLAVVEHVCSNVGELDYKHCSIIPDDPHLVALVLAKEAVYSAITNLVTAVRALTGSRELQAGEDYEQLRVCCENVVRTTDNCAACVRTCLHVDDAEANEMQSNIGEMRDHLENSIDLRRNQTLSVLGRKATSLNALQTQYDGSAASDIPVAQSSTEDKDEKLVEIGALAEGDQDETLVDDAQTIEKIDESEVEVLEIAHNDDTMAKIPQEGNEGEENATSPASSANQNKKSIASMLSDAGRSRQSLKDTKVVPKAVRNSKHVRSETLRRSNATTTARVSVTNSVSSTLTSNAFRQSARSSVDSFNQTPLTTPEPMSPVNEYDAATPPSMHQHVISKLESAQQAQPRARTSSINANQAGYPFPIVSSSTAIPLPPIPSQSTNQPELKMMSSKSTPTIDQSSGKSRRPRGMSVSTLRMSLKQKNEENRLGSTTNTETGQPIRRMASWMSISSVDKRDSVQDSEYSGKREDEPWFMEQRVFGEDEIMLNADGQVTGATLEALVEKLTLHQKSPGQYKQERVPCRRLLKQMSDLDLVFTRAFFYNFRLFTTPTAFVDLLIARFALEPPTEPCLTEEELTMWTKRVQLPVRLRVYNVIKTWLETYFTFEQDAGTERALMKFTTNEMDEAMPIPAKRMVELIRRTFTSRGLAATGRKLSYTNEARATLQKSSSGSHISLSSGQSLFSTLTLFDDHHTESGLTAQLPPSNITRSLRNTLRKALSQGVLGLVHVQDFDPLELARQLTLMESSLFCQIRPNEMIGQEFKKKIGCSSAIHVKAMIQRSTQVTSWVSDTILREPDPKKRAQMIKFWIKVGDCCIQLNNYNTLMAIRSALDSTSIVRLKKTWDCVSTKYKTMSEPIYRATDSQRNFAEYRQRLKNAVAPCLPFLGVYLTDMTFIDDGNSNHRMSPGGHQLINFDKYIKTTRVLNEIDQFQIPYRLVEVDEIQRYLVRCLETVEKDDQVFYTRSLKVEPREEEFDIRSAISALQ
ncbi:hypothetical protein DFQ28_000878 [Apophysomyces sp. BC1034]|nr:hypothetical protein DFQ30_000831 [Apophysomyces sp. BC1015]KAG0181729.1 hypothetical protein DFQ29_007274 [Apophysomyces sp. BC1021]KAG0191130.1 hypothetical protein DFQ28_000878 [Apophysomyces sp. BC1034]